MKEAEKCLESQLWHACAGGMIQMPPVNSVVFYFPQGHIEHAQGNVDLGACPRIPPLIPCRVTAIKFMADPETDEVFAKIRLLPVKQGEPESGEEDRGVGLNGMDGPDKLASFAKTLTQSDANNGGGFSVPRYCAETIFPRLDYSEDPPVQTVFAKDVHGEQWKFRHIYRGTPRRHLLTTGWSTFVNQKRLVAGDSIVFLRTDNGELCVGIRRAKRGIGDGVETPSGWNPLNGNAVGGPYGGYPVYMREEENKLMRSNGSFGNVHSGGGMRGRARVRLESVVEAITLAASGQPFEVVYYPRASTPEFCVKASTVRVAMRIQWQAGMRFKMAFETEDSSRISWFMGTISGVQVADPIRWPSSYWRLLQVTWDEPDLLQNVKRVSPWLVELVSNIPIHLSPFSPPRKKLRVPQHPEFPLDGQYPSPVFFGNSLGHGSSPLCCLPNGNTPAGIQGARHAQIDLSLSDLHLNKLQSSLFAGFHRHEYVAPNPRIGNGVAVMNPSIHDNLSCLLTMGNSSHHVKKSCETNTSPFLLFGQPILTEKQMSMSSSGDTVNSLSNGNLEKITNVSDNSVNPLYPSSRNVSIGHLQPKENQFGELGLEIGHCKVFIESEDVGRTLDLSVLSSYDELCRRLADMFGLEKSNIMGQVRYRDSAGALKQAGDEPFGDFTKTARRLTILMDSCSENTAR